jgi:sugar transferase (PEP-CTERM/EpsH1 system associated)
MTKPNLLYLTHRVPHPPNRGDRIRSYHTLKFLAERAHVYLGCLADELVSDETRHVLNQLCQRVEIDFLGRSRWIQAAKTMALGQSATVGLFHSTRLRSAIRQWASEIPFDAAIAFCSSMAPLLEVPELGGARKVVDLVDVDSQKWFDYAAQAPRWKSSLYQLEGRRLRQLEKSLPSRVDAITLVSEAEANVYRQFCPNDKTYAIENGVDLDFFTPAPDATANRCVFVGVLDYRPNVEGLQWFCRHVWPEVRRQQPDATFAIVGRRPNSAVKELAQLPGVELIGEVPDIRPHIAAAKVAIAPLQIARGVQNKVLEALAMAKPVIATPQALEGLDLLQGVDVLPATSSHQWIESLRDLFRNDQERRRLAERGREFVEARHSWPARLAALSEILRRPAGTSSSSSFPHDASELRFVPQNQDFAPIP